MAGEIASDAALVIALGSAVIGASGAIASQVVAGFITGRREQRKADADSKRWELEAEAKRRDRQIDRKIEVLSKFLSTAEVVTGSYRFPKDSISESHERLLGVREELHDLTEEIGILAPELYEFAQETWRRAAALIFRIYQESLYSTSRVLDEGTKAEMARDVEKIRRRLKIWSDTFREATRSYISHEPIESLESAVGRCEAKMSNFPPSLLG